MTEKIKPTSEVGNIRGEKEAFGKGKRYYTPLKEIRSLFLSGGTYTARELNHLTGSNDARKCISVLRHDEEMNIDLNYARKQSAELRYLLNPTLPL